MELQRLYFFTATIFKWRWLLERDQYKDILVESLKYLTSRYKIRVYGYVIMPNHIHLIWELLDLNGKELPHASFLKYTSHTIYHDLIKNHPQVLDTFKVESETRRHQFWQRDSLPVELYSPPVVYQKLDYIHQNPCRGKWMLSPSPVDYRYSSAGFYETGKDEFDFLIHIGERL